MTYDALNYHTGLHRVVVAEGKSQTYSVEGEGGNADLIHFTTRLCATSHLSGFSHSL
jgi:hypothetical protein